MSFKFNWGGFPADFTADALEMLTQALNKGTNKPANLVGPIVAKELDLGSQAPQLDVLEISELESDRFRAMFRMRYEGDGYLVLQTQVQANPLRLPAPVVPGVLPLGVGAAAAPLVVPMLLRISHLRLHGIVVLAVSKSSGVTLVFRSDPLVSVEVHSTFDSVPSVRRMLQREIEATLRLMFQEDLPLIVHEMSVREIRREEERRERERREGIERRQREIRRRRGVQSADGACGTGPVAAQLRQRLLEISAGHAGSVGAAEDAAPPRWSIDEGSAAHAADALTLSQFLHDDWERTQRQHAGSPGLPSDAADEAGVVLRPSENAGAARLASLMAMGQTLSPYTRRFAHTTMRADVSARAAYSLAEPLSPPAQSATPFSGSGVRSPFARTRKVRRKVHRLGNTE